MPAGCAIRLKQTLFNPIDHRPWIDVQQPADFMCRIDRLRGVLSLLYHAGQNSLPTLSIGYGPYFRYSIPYAEIVFYLSLF